MPGLLNEESINKALKCTFYPFISGYDICLLLQVVSLCRPAGWKTNYANMELFSKSKKMINPVNFDSWLTGSFQIMS